MLIEKITSPYQKTSSKKGGATKKDSIPEKVLFFFA